MRCLIILAFLFVACADDDPSAVLDGATGDLTPAVDQLSASGEAGTASVDFVVQGCAKVSAGSCSGVPPLSLTFTAVLAKGSGTSVSWDFGDRSPGIPGLQVSHTFTEVGKYDVTLSVAESGGTVSEQKAGFVVILPAEAGAPCLQDSACASKKCACAAGISGKPTCDFPLDGGICLQACGAAPCPARGSGGPGFVCVKLSPQSTALTLPAWRTELCLAGCQQGGSCQRTGFACKLSPAGSGWARACVPPGLEAVGAPCRTPGGALDHASCLGGQCLDLGIGGYCSATCAAGGCPEGTRCVEFSGTSIGRVCLTQCNGTQGCAGDPALACESPRKDGEYGFTVLGVSPTKGTLFCAPRRCTADTDCGLAGVCKPAGGGFCRSQ